MVHIRAVLVAFTCALGTSAASVTSRGTHTQLKECLNGDNVETKTMEVDGITLIFKSAPCPAAVESRRAAVSKRSPTIDSSLIRREDNGCTIPSICECGFPCFNVQCGTLGAPLPLQSDCNSLALALANLGPNAFTVAQGSATSVTGGTCEFAVINEALSNIQYCPADLAIHGLAVSQQCIGEELDAGLCTLSDNHAEVFVLNSSAS